MNRSTQLDIAEQNTTPDGRSTGKRSIWGGGYRHEKSSASGGHSLSCHALAARVGVHDGTAGGPWYDKHIGRYEHIAEQLTAAGIAVAGFDLPGHGHHPGNPQIASMSEQGWERAPEQIAAVNQELHIRFPEDPVTLRSFSLDS